MEIVLVGVNHKTAPVETRERLAVLEEHVPATLRSLLDSTYVREACVISTCNRTEFYCVGDNAAQVADFVVQNLSTRHALQREDLLEHLYHRFNEDAARHLFSVAGGLDSMILGEGQILGQVRKAHRLGLDNNAMSGPLNKMFERALRAGKRARTETKISQGASTLSFAAVELARKVYGDLRQRRVLVVGTGKMGLLTVKLLATAGIEHVTVLSRTPERAKAVAEGFSSEARWGGMDQLTDELVPADLVISSTGSPLVILTRAMVAGILRRRRYRPLFIADIAVPRDVEPSVNELEGVYLYNIDDLSAFVDNRMADRHSEVEKVRAIVEDEVMAFWRYFSSLDTVPAIRRLKDALEGMRAEEVAQLLARGDMGMAERERLEAFSRALVGRLLHRPITRLKDIAAHRNVREGMHFLMELFEAEDAASRPDETQPDMVDVSDRSDLSGGAGA
jgi:glutamyl-tRNA reductase